MSKQLTILAVDDVGLHRTMLTHFIRELGHIAVTAGNGQEAVDYCRASMPDMILMDIQMPVMDGFCAARHIRTLLAGRWIPIVFLSAMNEDADYLHGLEAGGDDYLSKPVNLPLLSAKISSLQRIIEIQSRLASSNRQLEQFYAITQQEHSLAQHVLESFNTAANAQRHNIQSWLKSAVHLSGDVICIARSPSGADHVMLADSTGHGLVAAICCLPAIDTFHIMTQRGFGIGKIAESINGKLYQTLPIGHFVAAALLAVDYHNGSITVWNGGIPCCSYINHHGEREKDFRSAHPPLGILAPEEFDPQQEHYQWQHDGEIIVCSDGITEAHNAAQQQFGEEGVLQAACAAAGQQTITRIAEALQQHLQQEQAKDDASLVVIGCQRQSALPPAQPLAEPPPQHPSLTRWQIRLAFDAHQLQEQDCQSIVIDWLNRLQLPAPQFRDVLFIINTLFKHVIDQSPLPLASQAASHELSAPQPERQRRMRGTEFTIDISRQRGATLSISLHGSHGTQPDGDELDACRNLLQDQLQQAIRLEHQPQQLTVHYTLH